MTLDRDQHPPPAFRRAVTMVRVVRGAPGLALSRSRPGRSGLELPALQGLTGVTVCAAR
jgi:hypothetical protein